MIAKKLILSGGVLVLFIIYSLGIRSQNPRLSLPPIATTSKQSSSHNTPTNTSSTASAASSTPAANATGSAPASQYKDGTYQGSVEDAYYGNVLVSATISGGKIKSVKFLQYPNSHSTSVYINQQAMPYLQQEAIQAQNSNVNIISGATFTSQAFTQSLSTALSKAQA